jgi:hypothetical protein
MFPSVERSDIDHTLGRGESQQKHDADHSLKLAQMPSIERLNTCVFLPNSYQDKFDQYRITTMVLGSLSTENRLNADDNFDLVVDDGNSIFFTLSRNGTPGFVSPKPLGTTP